MQGECWARMTHLPGLYKLGCSKKLCDMYLRLQNALRNLPDCNYKKYTEEIADFRIQNHNQVCGCKSSIETLTDCGIIEQLVVQGRNEVNLVEKVLAYKPFEPPTLTIPRHQWTWPPTK